jgi:hypothetical protein
MMAGLKLLIVGIVLLAAAVAALAADLDPATLFIGGGVCTFLGVIHLIVGQGGPAVSAVDASDARSLANIQTYGSPAGQYIDPPSA